MRVLAVIAVGACSSSAAPRSGSSSDHDEPQVAVSVAIADPTTSATDKRRWIAGDLHNHISPPDGDADVSLDQVIASAKQAHMDFIAITPHLHPSTWDDGRAERRRFWHDLAARARTTDGIVVIPGTEWTTRQGHFTVLGAELDAIDRDDFLAAAHAAGAFISVNHPYAVPTHIAGVRISDFDISYRVWSAGAQGFTAIDGAEVWNLPLAMANVISTPGGRTGEQRAWTSLDHVVRTEHRRLTAAGGTDDHHGHAAPTTWVLVDHASEAEIVAALRAGETCVGGPEAGSLTAHGDDPHHAVRIGGIVTGAKVTLSWTGTARLFIDDVDSGDHDNGFTHDTGGTLHTYRIVVGASRSGFIYANL